MASGRSTTPRRTLKTAVLPPTPRASTNTAAAVNPGERRSVRSASRRSSMAAGEAKAVPRHVPEKKGLSPGRVRGFGIARPESGHASGRKRGPGIDQLAPADDRQIAEL